MMMLDRLRQAGPGREHQERTPPLSHRLRVPIDLTNRPSIDRPSITDPDRVPPARCALAGLRHHLRRDFILRRPTSPQNDLPGSGSNIPSAEPPRPSLCLGVTAKSLLNTPIHSRDTFDASSCFPIVQYILIMLQRKR